MNAEDAQEYTESLGQIVAGSWRQVAWADRQGIPAALGLTTREWVDQRLGGYVRLAISDRREAVAELTAEGMSQREVADVLGVGVGTVNRDLDGVPDGTSNTADLDKTPDVVPDGTPEPEPESSPKPLEPCADSAQGSPNPKPEPAPPPTAEELAEREAERDRLSAIDRQVNRLRNLLDGWDTVTHLDTNPLRGDVLDAIGDFDRKRILTIEEVIHS